jgi:hypothetical protein
MKQTCTGSLCAPICRYLQNIFALSTQNNLQGDSESIQHADMFLGYATNSGFVSYRRPLTGSYYIQALSQMFSKHSWKEDVVTMTKIVCYQHSE